MPVSGLLVGRVLDLQGYNNAASIKDVIHASQTLANGLSLIASCPLGLCERADSLPGISVIRCRSTARREIPAGMPSANSGVMAGRGCCCVG